MATEDGLKTDGQAAETTVTDGTGTDSTGPAPGTLLRVEGLTVAYGDQTVVHGVDFALERGQSLALIGESAQASRPSRGPC